MLAGISAVNQNLQRQIPEWDPNYPRSWKPIANLFCGPRLASTPLIIALAVAFLLAVINLIDSIGLRGLPLNIGTHELFTAGELVVNVGVRIDGLTSVMLVVVTGVSLLVQVYSTGYMDGDHGYRRYFAFMALFTTSMLGLVLADNLLMLFAFWELVGLTSYLLIGFWFHRPAAAAAAKKAFLVTRLGDLGMLAAMILIFSKTGTLDIATINALADSGAEAGMFAFNGLLIGQTAMTLFGLGLIAGAIGKSAQFPLHIWLPDAMEGPTPVSALVHSATMVAAGVYLLARFFPVIHASSTASDLIAWIGAGTALGAAILAMVQVDIKRVLAYSTISQLAYMMFAIGVGGYAAAVFHLMTHAFFKAMLFLGSGSVNHSTNTFDMRKMGGLRTLMPITFGTFIIGTLALAGIVPLSGFWSKDEILIEAWDNNKGVFVLGPAGSRSDRRLHGPSRLHDLLRRVQGRRGSRAGRTRQRGPVAPARVAAQHDHAIDHSRRDLGRFRIPDLRRRVPDLGLWRAARPARRQVPLELGHLPRLDGARRRRRIRRLLVHAQPRPSAQLGRRRHLADP